MGKRCICAGDKSKVLFHSRAGVGPSTWAEGGQFPPELCLGHGVLPSALGWLREPPDTAAGGREERWGSPLGAVGVPAGWPSPSGAAPAEEPLALLESSWTPRWHPCWKPARGYLHVKTPVNTQRAPERERKPQSYLQQEGVSMFSCAQPQGSGLAAPPW